MNGLVQGIGPCTFETNWEIAQFRVSPAPDPKGDSGDIKEKGFLRVSHGGQEIHGYGITSV